MCQKPETPDVPDRYHEMCGEAANRDYVDNHENHMRCYSSLLGKKKHRLAALHLYAARLHKLADQASIMVEVEAMLEEEKQEPQTVTVVVFEETENLGIYNVVVGRTEEEALRRCRMYFKNDEYELGKIMIAQEGGGYQVASKAEEALVQYPFGAVETYAFSTRLH